jgi:hypothetical protein
MIPRPPPPPVGLRRLSDAARAKYRARLSATR